MDWFHISILLSIFGLLKEIRPSEPFISDFMQEPYRNVTAEEVRLSIVIQKIHLKFFEILKLFIFFHHS